MLWLACTTIVLITGFYVLLPLFRETEGSFDVDLLAETEPDRLLDRKAVIYKNIRDLQLDYKMGRLSDADFRQLETGYKNEAAAVLQRLDEMDASEHLDEMIEKEISTRKVRLHGSDKKWPDGPARCPSCGAQAIAGKRFCADCGQRL